MTMLTKVLAACLLALLLAVGVQTWRLRAAQHDTVEAAVAPAKQAAARAAAAVETVTVQLAARIDTVRLILHDTVRTPARVLAPTTHADTLAAVAALPVVEQKYGACREQLLALTTDCSTYRLTAERRFAADSLVISTQGALLRDRPPKRNWHIGITGGYGVVTERDSTRSWRIHSGPSVTAGITWTPF